MACRNQQTYIKGSFTHRRTQSDYMGALLEPSRPHPAPRAGARSKGATVNALAAIGKYADFHSRARRREYWAFMLVNAAILTFMAYIEGGIWGPMSVLYIMAIIVPSYAVTVRRLHDIGLSGWWILTGFVPFVGVLVLLVFAIWPGQRGGNRWGRNPGEAPAAA